jgi:hypothetical protein
MGVHHTEHIARRGGSNMAGKHVRRTEIVSILRSRGLQARADWCERELPEVISVVRNHSLLSTLDIDPATLTEADAMPDEGHSGGPRGYEASCARTVALRG